MMFAPTDHLSIALQRVGALSAPVPSTKGMSPKERADRLHAEMERRIVLAKDVERFLQRLSAERMVDPWALGSSG